MPESMGGNIMTNSPLDLSTLKVTACQVEVRVVQQCIISANQTGEIEDSVGVIEW